LQWVRPKGGVESNMFSVKVPGGWDLGKLAGSQKNSSELFRHSKKTGGCGRGRVKKARAGIEKRSRRLKKLHEKLKAVSLRGHRQAVPIPACERPATKAKPLNGGKRRKSLMARRERRKNKDFQQEKNRLYKKPALRKS